MASRFLLSAATNNPSPSWLDYLGLPDDLAEWTLDDLRASLPSLSLSGPLGGGGERERERERERGGTRPAGASAGAHAAFTRLEAGREVTLDDFERYLRTVGEPYRFLHANRPREGERSGERRREGRGEAEQVEQAELEGGNGAHDATRSPAAAHRLSVVPPVVFGDHFELTDPCTFEVFSPEGAPAATMVMIEKLANYLDQVRLGVAVAPTHSAIPHARTTLTLHRFEDGPAWCQPLPSSAMPPSPSALRSS
eukprot:scaffold86504_cov26-Tisochrysis_lutea.AAC.1